MKIVYFANPESFHDAKWINEFSRSKEVAVVCEKDYLGLSKQLNPGIEVYPVLEPVSYFPGSSANTERAIKSILAEHSPDVVHSMYAMPNSIWADSVAGTRHIITTRGSDLLVDYSRVYSSPRSIRQQVSFRLLKRSFKRAVRRARFITSPSYRLHRMVVDLRGTEEGTAVIRTGVDAEVFVPTGEARSSEEFRIFCPRSMKPVYNIDLLVMGFKLYCDKHAEVKSHLYLIDDLPGTPYSDKVKELVSQLGLSNRVVLLSKMDQTDMIECYNLSDLVVMIPASDGTPVSAIEAMMLERPVLLGPLDYDSDLFNENTVKRAEGFTPEQIAKALKESAKDSFDEERLRKARAVAIENASLQRSIEKVDAIYNEIGNPPAATH